MPGTLTPADRLVAWYDRHHRDLPWRVAPRDRRAGIMPDPYRVWLSEIMLQQTSVRAVKPYFAAFVQRWPRVGDLASADETEVLGAWAGLGYYSRARNLKRCAETIAVAHGGIFPDTAAGLRALPGIGAYTAAAIAAIAFDRPEPVVDGNVERVTTRLFAIETPLPRAKPEIGERVAELTPDARPGDFAQAMMDLGATICTPRRPACAICPLNADCAALATMDPETLPRKAPKKEKPARRGAAFVAIDGTGAVYLTRRPDKGLLAGMAQVPTTGWTSRLDGDTTVAAAPFEAAWHRSGTIEHVFTHFSLRLDIFGAELVRRPETAEGWWSPPERVGDEALPTVMKKAIAAAFPDTFRR
ncbi:A/G-specific adenine glycosylase [Pararhizobium mangrovi]|uniref:Adenine DNA glycosylase n=1 Tax=Pararhizobium mangrovi TaxID=2590452 RepID=A0A506U6V7_9HYPH|nr:A/G-specific adenine glycosylase [Pararhizobium mangrovi]TPW28685.1 A/G-specific adenine glycosylase [Pararhizobium mangrovi]